ncbi:MAG: hypothetical protein HWN67_01455 [Candidatus Helarchaeota archaeon]|nr:hypothetical protein [Candidatus Helarchaeota archaeon]
MEHKGEFAMGIIGLVLAGVGGLILGTGLMFRMAANRMLSMSIGSVLMMIMMTDGDSSMIVFSLITTMSQGQRMLNISTVITIVGALFLIVGAILAIIGWTRYIQLEHGKI